MAASAQGAGCCSSEKMLSGQCQLLLGWMSTMGMGQLEGFAAPSEDFTQA